MVVNYIKFKLVRYEFFAMTEIDPISGIIAGVPQNLPSFQAWLLAIRPKTLPAAVAPVLVGAMLALRDNRFRLGPTLACLLAALLLQIGSNLANDVFDFEKGADSGERFGPIRVSQAGLLMPGQVRRGMWTVFGVTAILGIYLIFQSGWPILVLGVAAIISAIAYTGGPYPLGYHGLGDLFVFIFFGLAATAGTYYVQVGIVTLAVWWMAVAMGLLTVNILVVNNLRDIENDRRFGKKTMAVRLGSNGVRIEYLLSLLGAFAIPVILWLTKQISVGALIVLVLIPQGMQLIRSVYEKTGRTLNKTLAATGRFELFYAFLFSIGIILEKLFSR
jgi:1,4-dihydroxy-2-naphthoate octaprenyltransferase